MNKRQEATAIDPNAEQMVASYLRSCPDFFVRHLDLLNTLRIPHDSGSAISLLERQLLLLREQNKQLHKRLHELVEVARDNDCLSKRMQSLMLSLIEITNLDDLLLNIQCVLRDDFNADFIALRLAAQPVASDLGMEKEFNAADLPLFAAALRSDQALCGRLTAAQALALFEDAAPRIGSVALVPLRGDDWYGLLAIGSRDKHRFHPGIGTLFLSRIGELLSHALAPYLRSIDADTA